MRRISPSWGNRVHKGWWAGSMTAMAVSPVDRGYRHEAAIYRGDRGFLDVAVDFVRDGVSAGETVLVALIPHKIEMLRTALGPAASAGVRFVDMAQAGANPARLIPMWREVVDASGGAPLRGLGEPVWQGRRPAQQAEALLHEALLNLAFAGVPKLLMRCPYDAEALGEELVAGAHRRHPTVVEGGASGCGAGYHDGAAAAEFAAPLREAAPADSEAFDFADIGTARALRAEVGTRATGLGITADRAADLVLALHEIAVNSLRHGGGAGRLRIWADEVEMVCEVTDAGHIDRPLVGRVRPGPEQLSGRGVWLANQLCDLVRIRSSPAGTTVRLHMTI